jgi:cysteine desulfurase
MAAEAKRLTALRDRFLAGIRTAVPEVRLNGDATRRLPANLNLTFPGLGALDLMAACPGLALSTGSACTAAEVEPSYVLRALGLSDELGRSSLRIGLGRFTTEGDVDFAVDALAAAARRLRVNPLKLGT